VAESGSPNVIVPVGVGDPTHNVQSEALGDTSSNRLRHFGVYWSIASKKSSGGLSRQQGATHRLKIVVSALIGPAHRQAFSAPEYHAMSVKDVCAASSYIRDEKLTADCMSGGERLEHAPIDAL
jgi:hypothetical protein